jgi:hypothetical protein
MTFIPNVNYLEFVPEDEYWKWLQERSYRPRIMALDEVLPGQRYVVVITNFLGGAFVRYVLDDIILITALRNEQLNINTPQMLFYGRAGDIIDFGLVRKYARRQPSQVADRTELMPLGEVFTHVFFNEKMVWRAINNSGCACEEWMARKEVQEDRALIHVYVEPKVRGSFDEKDLSVSLHEQLKRANENYADLESFLGYKPLRVTLLPEGTFGEYMSRMRAAGADLAHVKPPHMNAVDSVMEALQAPRIEEPAAVPNYPDRSSSGMRS